MRFILLLIISISSLQLCYSQKNIKPDRLIEDFDYAVQELHAQHQGFYHYLSKPETDTEITKLRNTLTEPKTKLEFYQTIRKLVALMNEGHGSVKLPKSTMTKVGLSKSFLPIALKYIEGKWIVTQNFGEDIPALKKGMRIVSINNVAMEDAFQKLASLIATDGFNTTSQYRWMGGLNFSLLYRLVYGASQNFTLEVVERGTSETKTIQIPAVKFTTFKSKTAKYQSWKFDYTKFLFKQINDSVAYLSIPSFSAGEIDYEAFYKKQFHAIDSLNIKHLIIDIQANTGGEEGNENLLFSYLTEKRIRKYTRATMLPGPFQKRLNHKSIKADKWAMKDSLAERGEYTLYSDYYSDLGYLPPKLEHIYKHKVYVLISGLTFSGGAEFASMIKMTDRGIFIGQETGGTYDGNVSSFNETVKLPHTKIKINIPIVHYQMHVKPSEIGRGIIPGHHVPQTWADYLNKKNTKLEYVLRLIAG
ncbi:MAG: S41 family peptidase [Bacteroidia bacterium]